jgi:hypothetical protein
MLHSALKSRTVVLDTVTYTPFGGGIFGRHARFHDSGMKFQKINMNDGPVQWDQKPKAESR